MEYNIIFKKLVLHSKLYKHIMIFKFYLMVGINYKMVKFY